MLNLSDLLGQIDIDFSPEHGSLLGYYKEIRDNIDDYKISRINSRRELKILGRDNIPKEGRILSLVDNEFYDLQDEAFKEKFSQLSSEEPRIILEYVERVIFFEGSIEITIGCYLIQRNK